MISPKIYLNRATSRLNALFGSGLVVTMALIGLIGTVLSIAAFMFFNTAAPRTLTMSSGPADSSFNRNAERYQKALAREGVTLKILPSDGSSDNLKRLLDPKSGVDIGFVLDGEGKGKKIDELVTLGSVAHQPLMIFYTGKVRTLLSEFKGQRLNIGPSGSGTNALGLALLKANGIVPGDGTTLEEADLADPEKDLRDGRIDAVFLMSDSTSTRITRELIRDEQIHLFSFVQADGYVRRINTLNKLHLPRGALDFGKDIPAEDVYLLGPTVQLLARESLHPALSDLLLETAREVHGRPGLYRKRGEFPAPNEGEFRLSSDASRYYASGKSFLYRTFPFWLASLIARILAVLVPVVLLLIPALRFAPQIYRWRIESRIYRWYKVLLEIERDYLKSPDNPQRRQLLLGQLDDIETAVNRIVVPSAFGDLFYGLRGHIGMVRKNLRTSAPIQTASPIPDGNGNVTQNDQ